MYRRIELQNKELAALKEANKGLVEGVKDAMSTIKALHGEVGWSIYEKSAPEYKRLKQALKTAKDLTDK